MIRATRIEGAFGPLLLDGVLNGEAFLAFAEQIVLPALQSDDVVVMDNLSTHKIELV